MFKLTVLQGGMRSEVEFEGGRLLADVLQEGENGYEYTSGNHTNRDVPVYAFGPEVGIFNDVATENIDIARFIAGVFGDYSFGQSVPVPPRN